MTEFFKIKRLYHLSCFKEKIKAAIFLPLMNYIRFCENFVKPF